MPTTKGIKKRSQNFGTGLFEQVPILPFYLSHRFDALKLSALFPLTMGATRYVIYQNRWTMTTLTKSRIRNDTAGTEILCGR